MAVAMRLIVRSLKVVAHAILGALAVLIVVFVLYLEGRADLQPWHLLELDEEFTAATGLADFDAYLALEARLFAQLDADLYERLPAALRHPLNRYTRDSLADPGRWARNWNRSFELSADTPEAGVLLLHGMSDSPYQYKSFAVNAGDLVHRLTGRIQTGLRRLARAGRLEAFPPVLALSSVVDATVSVSALVDGPLRLLPPGAHELVLFDINRRAVDASLLSDDPATAIQRLRDDPQRRFTLSVVSNRAPDDARVRVRISPPGEADSAGRDLDLDWPPGVYSLSHVALPFALDDPLYGEHPARAGSGLHLGNLALRGERGVLRISASERLRWNPFFPYLQARVLEAVGLAVGFPARSPPPGRRNVDPPPADAPPG